MPRLPLEQSIRDPGFTPSVRDLDAIVDLLANDDLAKHAERAVARVGPAAVDVLQTRFETSKPPLRSRIIRTVGRFPDDPRLPAFLIAALADADPKTRRNAAIALGHVRGEGVEEALLDAWQRDPRPEMRRSVAASLGKTGSSHALPLLREAVGASDGELARIAERATMMLERTASRADRGRLDGTRAPHRPTEVLVLARRGIEDLLAEELVGIPGVDDVRGTGPGLVRATLNAPMRVLFGARTMLSFRFPLPSESVRDGDQVRDAIARAVTSNEARAIFATWTDGVVRYRIAWGQGGHQRAATWEVAQAVARRAHELVNDPTASLWELIVSAPERGRNQVDAALAPRALEDPRFTWRQGDVPAASHPTLAAALARVAGVRRDDVVWDPFVGAGAELIERALLGPTHALVGSDIDDRALSVSQGNLAAAGVQAQLERADATVHAPRGVTLIITNPPMGRRAARSSGLGETLDRFVAHAASVLVPGGRLVWLAPWPARACSGHRSRSLHRLGPLRRHGRFRGGDAALAETVRDSRRRWTWKR